MSESIVRDRVVKGAFQYRDALMSYAYVSLRDWNLAEDVLQDAFLVVMDKWESFQEGTSLFAWVRQIVRYKVLEALRARGREHPVEEQELLDTILLTVDKKLDEERAEHQMAMRDALQSCMSKLGDHAVKLLNGFYWLKESCDKLAQKHSKTVNSVRLSLSRLRKKLHECMLRRMETGDSSPDTT